MASGPRSSRRRESTSRATSLVLTRWESCGRRRSRANCWPLSKRALTSSRTDERKTGAWSLAEMKALAAARNRIMLAPDLTCQAAAWPASAEQRALASQSGEVPFEEGGDARIGDEAVAQLD